MGIYSGTKAPVPGAKRPARGGWPVMQPVPGNGDVLTPSEELSPSSAAHHANGVEDIFGVGKALQESSPGSRQGKLPSGGEV